MIPAQSPKTKENKQNKHKTQKKTKTTTATTTEQTKKTNKEKYNKQIKATRNKHGCCLGDHFHYFSARQQQGWRLAAQFHVPINKRLDIPRY